MIFRRRREEAEAADQSDVADDVAQDTAEDVAEASGSGPGEGLVVEGEADHGAAGDGAGLLVVEYDRSNGPFDIAEVDEADAMAAERIDLGAVQIPLVEGLEIRVEIDQQTNQPVAVTLIRGEGAVQVRPFSAPRSSGTWGDAIGDIRQQIIGDGGTVDIGEGKMGTEMRAMVAAQDEKGQQVLQAIRFVGVDGPRWMLQGVLLGEGTVPEQAGELEDVFCSIVVVRGDTAMPPGVPLPLSLPEQVPGDVSELDEEVDEDEEED